MKFKRKIYLFLLLFISKLLFSQNPASEAVYQFVLKMDSVSMSKSNDRLKQGFIDAEIASKKIKPKLIFNDTIALFQGNEIMDIGKNKFGLKIAQILCKCDKPYYTDLKQMTNYFISGNLTNSKKDKYLVYKKLDTNWELHNESKKINNYLCYKATQVITIKNGAGEFKHIITAWYCPEIPYSYGPKGYGGLPGLIFELQDKNGFYGLESLSLKTTNLKIELPKELTLISYENYENIINVSRKSNDKILIEENKN